MRRKLGLFLVCGLVLPLVVAASASAQGSTLLVSDSTPTPGQAITVTGRGYSAPAGTSSISLRFNRRNATPFASPVPDTLGRISATFPAPSTPGWYLILATQTTTANNRQRSFSPGRTRIKVSTTGTAATVPTGGGGRGVLPDSPLGLLAVGSALLLLAAGTTLTVRRIRTLNRPQLDSQAR
jgi:hypothetical protein